MRILCSIIVLVDRKTLEVTFCMSIILNLITTTVLQPYIKMLQFLHQSTQLIASNIPTCEEYFPTSSCKKIHAPAIYIASIILNNHSCLLPWRKYMQKKYREGKKTKSIEASIEKFNAIFFFTSNFFLLLLLFIVVSA